MWRKAECGERETDERERERELAPNPMKRGGREWRDWGFLSDKENGKFNFHARRGKFVQVNNRVVGFFSSVEKFSWSVPESGVSVSVRDAVVTEGPGLKWPWIRMGVRSTEGQPHTMGKIQVGHLQSQHSRRVRPICEKLG